MRKIIIANTIIFFLFQISTAQQKNIKNDTLVLDEVTIQSVKIPLKEKKSLYPITQINFKNGKQWETYIFGSILMQTIGNGCR